MGQQLTFSWGEPPANPSPLPVSEKDWTTLVVNSCTPLLNLLQENVPSGWFGKTSPVSFPVTREETLQAFWDCSQAGTFKPLSEVGVTQDASKESPQPTELRGQCSMLKITGLHSGASESLLSDTLEVGNLPQRYYLSATACQGILRRAEKRGKQLPQMLKEALEAVAYQGSQDHLTPNVGGGKLTHQSVNNGHLVPEPIGAFRMTAFGEYADDNTASTLKQRDYKDATDLVAHKPSWWNGEQTAATLTKQNANVAQRMPDKDNFGAVLEPKAHAFKVRGGSEDNTGEQGGTPGKKAGKGYLGQDEKVFTIGTTQDQQIAQPIAYENRPSDARVKPMGETCQTLTSRLGTGGGNLPLVQQPIPIHDQATRHSGKRGDNQDGKGNGLGIGKPGNPMNTLTKGDSHAVATPIAYSFDSLSSNSMKSSNHVSGCNQVEVAKTIDTTTQDPSKNQGGIGIAQPIPFDTTQLTSPSNYSNPQPGDPCHPLAATAHIPTIAQPIAVDVYNQAIDGQVSATITEAVGGTNTSGPKVLQPVAFDTFNQTTSNVNQTIKSPQGGLNESIGVIAQPVAVDCYNQTVNEKTSQTIGSSASDVNHYGAVLQPNIAPTLTASNDPSRSPQSSEITNQIKAVHQATMAIRRLTPTECERLQGFPDSWTKIPYRNKPADQCPDGPRYKACGNSMAVPCMAWLGQRIQMVDDILNEQKNGTAIKS